MERGMERDSIENILKRAMSRFNYVMDTNYSFANIRTGYFNHDNAVEVYEHFCRRYFPGRLAEDYHAPQFFENVAASAFAGAEYDGILCNEPFCMAAAQKELYEIFLHELSHIFCCHNEIEGGDFYGRYCCNHGADTYTDGIMNAGYALWREFIAGVMADNVCEYNMGTDLRNIRTDIMRCWIRVTPEKRDAKMYLSQLLVLLFTSREIATSAAWNMAEGYVRGLQLTEGTAFYELVKEVWENLYRGEYWEISGDFIYALGNLYFAVLAGKYKEASGGTERQ